MNTRALPPLNQLRAFEAAARHLSFTAAAGELNMTQSAVSQQIKSLEGYLGQPLFYRRPRALELTVTGLNYLPVVRDAFQTLSRGTRMLVDGDARDGLQVQCNLTFATCWLAPRLPRLYARHPDLHMQINTAIWDPMERGDMADIEIRLLMAPARDRPATRLTWDRFYPVCAPGYQVSLADISRHRLFYCTAMLTTWDAWAEGAGLPAAQGPRVTHAQVLATAMAAAEAGAGLAMTHDCAASHAIAQGRLVRPFAGSVRMHEAYYLSLGPQAENSTQAQAFAAWIKAEMAADYPLSGSDIGPDGTQA